MSETPLHQNIEEREYRTGFAQVIWLAEQARLRGWKLSDRQLVHEILQRERAARIREKSSLPIIGAEVRSAAWNRGQADALRLLLRAQRKRQDRSH